MPNEQDARKFFAELPEATEESSILRHRVISVAAVVGFLGSASLAIGFAMDDKWFPAFATFGFSGYFLLTVAFSKASRQLESARRAFEALHGPAVVDELDPL